MDEKELFEQFMHHNIPQEAFDPDQVLAAARKAVPDDYQPSEHFKKDMDKLLRQSRRQARIGSAKKFFTRKGFRRLPFRYRLSSARYLWHRRTTARFLICCFRLIKRIPAFS